MDSATSLARARNDELDTDIGLQKCLVDNLHDLWRQPLLPIIVRVKGQTTRFKLSLDDFDKSHFLIGNSNNFGCFCRSNHPL